MFRRRVRLIYVPMLLVLFLAVGAPFTSKTAGLFNSFGNLFAQREQPQSTPQSTSTRAFSGSLPSSGKFTLNVARRNHTATALADGGVLLIGGDNQDGMVSEAELLDPKSSTLVVTARSLTARTKHAATLLADGKVLVTGGSNADGALDSTEIFDPKKNDFVEGPRLQRARVGHSATLLADGKVLIAGGSNDDSAEIYDPATKQFSPAAGKLKDSRAAHSALLLPNGNVLLVGGKGVDGRGLESAEIFNAATQRFSSIASTMMMPRVHAALRALPDGKVQIIGGDYDGSMEIFDPRTGQFAALAHLAPTAELFPQAQMLGAPTRAGFTEASTYRDVKSPYPVSNGFKAAFAAFKKQELGRTNYAVAELPASHLAVIAGGVNDDRQILSSVLALPHSTATLSTSLAQYRPGQAPVITGTGWQAGEVVTIIRQEANLSHERATLRAVADAQGNFVCADLTAAAHQNWTTYTLTANGKSSRQVAQTVYQDLPPAGKEKEALGLLKFKVPIASHVISVETDTVTVKLTPDGATVNEEGRVNAAAAATCTVPTGSIFNLDVDFSSVISKPCLGDDISLCGDAGDVQLKDACLSISGGIDAELCLLCEDGMGGFIEPYAKFAIQENFKQQTVLAVNLSKGLRLPLFKIPIPKVSVGLVIPGINPRVFETVLGLTASGELEAIVNTPGSFEVSLSLAEGFETGFDTRLSPAGYLRTTTPPNATGNINVFTLGNNSVRFKLGPNVGLTVNFITTIIDFGENLLGFLEVNLTDSGVTNPTCISGNVDLFAGMEGNIFLKALGAPELRLSYDFFKLRIAGFPKPVAIKDTQPPDILANDITQPLSLTDCMARVSYTPVILDFCSGVDAAATTVTPPSGSSFPLGDTNVTVKAKDNKGNEATKTFKVTVVCPSITLPATLSGGVVGTAYSQSVAATPAANYGYSVTGGALPPGLSLNPATGLLSGTPSQAGLFNFTIQAAACNCSASMSYALNVVCPTISITRIGESFVTATQPYNATLTALPANGNYTYSISAGALPSGMDLSSDGKITGSSATAGLSTFTVRATGFGGACQGTQQFTILVTCQNFDIGLFSATGPVAGIPFDGNLRVRQFGSAVSGNYTFTQINGTLPPGLTLTPEGRLFGTPSQVGNFIGVGFTAVGDGLCPAVGFLNFTINCPTTPATLSTLPFGQALAPYDQTLTTSIGALPYTYQVIAGALPPGLTLSSTGRLSGTPTRAGTYSFTVQATDTAGCSATGTYNFFRIDCPLVTFTSPTSGGTYLLPDGAFGAAYNQTVSVASPAGFTYAYTVTGTLPPGLTLSPDGRITGTPTNAGQFTFGIAAATVGDGFGDCGSASSFRLTIPCPTITIPPLPKATLTVPYDQTLAPLPGEGAPYRYDNVFGTPPPGLTFDVTTGRLYGTPTQTGTFTFRVRAAGFLNNACLSDAIATTIALTVECPAVTTSPLPDGVLTVPYNQTLTASPGGSYTFSFAGGTLPPGLNFTNGVISGTPTQLGTFNFNVTATATSSALNTCTRTLSYAITINCPTVTLSSLPGGTASVAYNQTLTALPAGGNYTFALTSGALPPGLNLTNGAITGTPSQAGTFGFTVTATGFGVCTGARTYTLVIGCPAITLAPASLPNATANTTYNQSLSATPNGTIYSFSVTSGFLPPGLTLNSDGSFSGAPAQSGVFNFRVTATGFGACSGFRDYQLQVNCSTVSLTPTTLPDGLAGAAYNQTVTASPAGAYSYSVTSGALPAGLSLATATGRITGTPTESGSFTFTITASASECRGSRSYTINIGCSGLSIVTASLPAGLAGIAYSQTISVSPAGNYTFSLAQGNLPSGVTLNPQTGVISGLPNVVGTSNFIVKVQTTGGCLTTQSYALQINCPTVALAPASLPDGATAAAYNQSFSATPAGGNYRFTLTAGALPPGLSLNSATGALTGTPTQNGAFNFTITATGFGSCSGSKAYSVAVGNGSCPTITLPELPGGQPGQLYNTSVTASPAGSYSYAVTAGSLPPGLTLFGNFGLLYGYPTTTGTFDFTITATSLGDANNCTGSKNYRLAIGGAATRSLVFGDFDGDGKADLSVWRGVSGQWLTVASGDGKLKTEAWGTSAAPYFDVMTPGDYDGDGKMDLAVFRKSTGEWLIKRSSDGAVTANLWGLGTDTPVPGDYDGDGKTDIAVWRGADTNWYIVRSSDGQTQTVSWGTSKAPYNDVPVAADFDGDGKTDIAVFRQANGRWYIRQSSDGVVVNKAWGLGTDVPVAADYDGDGRADIAVWRGAEGNWYIIRSSDGAVQSLSLGSSALGEMPAPGDFDGDGKADAAIWRAKEGHWHILGSRDGKAFTQSHGAPGDLPVMMKAKP